MKTILLKLALIIISLSVFFNVYADVEYKKVTLPVSIICISIGEIDDDDPADSGHTLTHRIPVGTTECGITYESGVMIRGNYEIEILSYEIRTPDGEICILDTEDEKDFTITLFSLTGEYELRFYTADHLFIGYVNL